MPHRFLIQLGGQIIADTQKALGVLETHHAPTYYLPSADVLAVMQPVPGQSFCEWKGVARYFDVSAAAKTAKRAA